MINTSPDNQQPETRSDRAQQDVPDVVSDSALNTVSGVKTEPIAPTQTESPKISIEDFKKLEMTIGEIKTAERVPDTDKLIRLTVDVGEPELRQIISGIAAWFPEPEILVGKKVPFVTNLAPRTMRGLESNGMILAASDDEGHFSLLEVDQRMMVGTHLS